MAPPLHNPGVILGSNRRAEVPVLVCSGMAVKASPVSQTQHYWYGIVMDVPR